MDILDFQTALPEQRGFYELFITTGWNEKYQLNSNELYQALKNSWYLISVYNENSLVGFGRIICDGWVHALVLDLIVHPGYQNKGIGGQILDRLVKKCKQHQIRDIQLFSAKGYAGFYEKRGFKKRTDDAPGMEYKITD